MALENFLAHLILHSSPAKSAQASVFWSAEAAFLYGNTTILESTSGVFDTGSTLLGLATSKLLRGS